MKLIFLVEEASMKTVLNIILPKILPADVPFRVIPHCGKSDLQKSIPRKLKAWREPDARFVIVQDQDSADCRELKQKLLDLTSGTGKTVLIRIACKELESWYFGDLKAVAQAYERAELAELAAKKKFRNPDKLGNPKEELHKLVPCHQQIEGAEKIAPYMDINCNTSVSFQYFVSGVRKLVGDNKRD